MALIRGYETRLGRRLAAEMQSRVAEAAEIAAPRVEASIQRALAPYTDTGRTAAGVSVEPYGGPGAGGFRNVGLIAKSEAESSEWLDKGTRDGITRPSGALMPVGARSPDRRNAPIKGVTRASIVSGQDATRFFSAPTGVPLAEHMRNVFAGIYRRLR